MKIVAGSGKAENMIYDTGTELGIITNTAIKISLDQPIAVITHFQADDLTQHI
jgi:hypothetical protein